MFADSSTSRLMRESWQDIARSWEELAGLKERAARERVRVTQQDAALKSKPAQASADKR